MSQKNVWTKGQSSAASRGPQNRSNTASPSHATPSQAPASKNVWQQRKEEASARSNISSNGQQRNDAVASPADAQQHKSINGFNTAEVNKFLGRDTRAAGAPASAGGNKMANGQPFFQVLAKQIASLEAGG